jgi:flagellar basal-body rod protein FlgF
MLTGLYSAGSAMEAASKRHDVVAQNLANAQMPGYRRLGTMHVSRESQFADHLRELVQFEIQGVNAETICTDFTPGPLQRTDNPLDLAIQGEGFFVIEGPQGPLYTRNGSFQLDASGMLMTADQLPVAGQITLPPGTSLSEVQVATDGTIYAGAIQVGKIEIVTFPDLQKLQPVGASIYAAPPDLPAMPASGMILQNMREASNVSPIHELVELIAAQRQHEAAQRSMNAISEAVGRYINSSMR